MRRLLTLTCTAATVLLLAGRVSAQWLDTFDNYALGPLAAQSDWEEWSGSTGVDADVVNTFSFTEKQSVRIVTNNDVVYDFVNLGARPSSGQWMLSVKTLFPNLAAGKGWVILLNQYPTPMNWSCDISFDTPTASVTSDAGGDVVPLIRNEWISLRVWIDLDNDSVYSWYGDQALGTDDSWQDGISGGGINEIAVVDLYGDSTGCNAIYYDQTSLVQAAAFPTALDTRPNPAVAGDVVTFTTSSPLLPNRTAALFVSSVMGFPSFILINVGSTDALGQYTLGGTVPGGLAGINVGFRSVVVSPSGAGILGNEDLVLFR